MANRVQYRKLTRGQMFFPQLVLAAQLEGDPLPDPGTSNLQPPLRSPQIGHSTVAYNLYQFPNLTSDMSSNQRHSLASISEYLLGPEAPSSQGQLRVA